MAIIVFMIFTRFSSIMQVFLLHSLETGTLLFLHFTVTISLQSLKPAHLYFMKKLHHCHENKLLLRASTIFRTLLGGAFKDTLIPNKK